MTQTLSSMSCQRLFGRWAAALATALVVALAGAPARAADFITQNGLVAPAGMQRPLSVSSPIERLAVGDPAILGARVVGPNDVLLLGLKPGRTNLIVWEAGGARAYVFPVVVPLGSGDLQRDLRDDPDLAGVSVAERGSQLLIKGYVSSNEAHAKAVQMAQRYFPDSVVDNLRVMQQQMVSVEVRFAALSTKTLKQLGFNFVSASSGFQFATTGPTTNFPNPTGAAEKPISEAFNLLLRFPNSDISSVLSLLAGAQLAQILAEPTLLVRSGESAEFIAGGEIPIPVPQGTGDTITIEFREFGIKLKVAATVLSPSRILLNLAPEVSELDFTRAITINGFNIPAISKRAASSTLELGNGQSFVLAGLISQTISHQDDAVPLLGDLPIIGAFFKRQASSRERQELIIVATPRLVSPLDPRAIPPLPGAETADFTRSDSDLILGRNRVKDVLPQHGLMP